MIHIQGLIKGLPSKKICLIIFLVILFLFAVLFVILYEKGNVNNAKYVPSINTLTVTPILHQNTNNFISQTTTPDNVSETECPQGEYQYGVPYGCVPLDFCKSHNCSAYCLSSETDILTQEGNVNVKDVKVGTKVWTLNKSGEKVLMPVIKIGSAVVPKGYQVIHVILRDGRSLYISPGHPTTERKAISQLKVGQLYDGSTIENLEYVNYIYSKTYDILPAGDTGYYFANNILVASTLDN